MGKSTLVRAAVERRPDLVLSVSATTRAPRAGETDGVHYRFYDRATFEKMRDAGELLEWAEVHGEHLYGTPRAPVEEALAAGKKVLLEIDVQGARQVKDGRRDSVTIFVLPPTWEVLEGRLEGRGTEAAGAVARRLRTALRELASEDEFDERIVNDDLDESVAELLRIIDERNHTGGKSP